MSIECRHIVAVGDTLFQIAERYGTTVEKLGFLNMLKSEALSVGQELILPDCYDPFSNDSLEFICQSLYEDMVVRSTSQVLSCHVVDINSIDKHRALASGLIAAVDVMGYVEPGVEVCFRSLGDLVFIDAATDPPTPRAMESYRNSVGMTVARRTASGQSYWSLRSRRKIPTWSCQAAR